MNHDSVNKTDTLSSLPPVWPESLLPAIRSQVAAANRTLVVLDDDPTGTQTVHDVSVLTGWSVDELSAELARGAAVFYVLTNSRSLPLAEAQALNRTIGADLLVASRRAKRDIAVVSRSDSTLRGHYPGEVDALAAALGQTVDATLIIPFFLEGGRYTIGDVHYVAEGDLLTPAAATPFAQDAAFGYHASDLRQWVQEKTAGRVMAAAVVSISLADLRVGGPQHVAGILRTLHSGVVCVVNAAAMRDLEVLVAALLDAEAHGKQFLYRTAASFVQVRGGIEPRPLLTRAELLGAPFTGGQAAPGQSGGLFVVGSYVPKTTAQVNELLAQTPAVHVEIRVAALLDDAQRERAIDRAARTVEEALVAGKDTVMVTGRQLVTGEDAAASLAIGRRISDSLVAMVGQLRVKPRYLVAKGGITSSDIATKALGIRRAVVLGQILPGVPVWQTGAESRYPGLPYIVFPGNVGDADALVQIYRALR